MSELQSAELKGNLLFDTDLGMHSAPHCDGRYFRTSQTTHGRLRSARIATLPPATHLRNTARADPSLHTPTKALPRTATPLSSRSLLVAGSPTTALLASSSPTAPPTTTSSAATTTPGMESSTKPAHPFRQPPRPPKPRPQLLRTQRLRQNRLPRQPRPRLRFTTVRVCRVPVANLIAQRVCRVPCRKFRRMPYSRTFGSLPDI